MVLGARAADVVRMVVREGAVLAGAGVAALLPAWLPARRAARVDPAVALRAE